MSDCFHEPSTRFIFNHDVMNCTADGVVGNHLYSARALGISEPSDVVQLHPDLKTHWQEISAHYDRVGLSYSKNVIWDLNLNKITSFPDFQPSLFFYGPEEYQYWKDEDWLDTVGFINSKNNFIALAENLGIDVPVTRCFDRADSIDRDEFEDIKYPCYLKAAVSVAGVGIYRCVDPVTALRAINQFDPSVPVQIQEQIKAEAFLNLQYAVVGERLVRLAASEQILDGYAHQGNRVPASHEPWASVDPMADWLKNRGIRGIFAFDVAVVQTGHSTRFPAIECNPRFNGASYPTLIAQKLGVDEWTAINFSTHCQRLQEIDLGGLEFDQVKKKGVVIVNWGTIGFGKLSVLVAGPREYQDKVLVDLTKRL